MKKYGNWFVDELTPEARAIAQETADEYRKTLKKMQTAAAPGSVVETVGIPRVKREIESREEFIRCCDAYAADKENGLA